MEHQAHARSSDPSTSHKAARAVTPRVASKRKQTEAYARGRGAPGFTDEQLSDHFNDPEHSTYRTRRSELTAENRILDSGRRDRTGAGLECIVWVHRDFVPGAPPLVMAVRGKARDVLKGEAMSTAAKLRLTAAGLRRTHGLDAVAREIEEAAELLFKLGR